MTPQSKRLFRTYEIWEILARFCFGKVGPTCITGVNAGRAKCSRCMLQNALCTTNSNDERISSFPTGGLVSIRKMPSHA
jgi:hypothetical protein